MGCGGSKNAVVPSAGSSQAWSERPAGSSAKTKAQGRRANSDLVRVKSGGSAAVAERAVSRESLRSGAVRGVSSATSKASAHTCDSGLEADYGNVITEDSDPSLVQQVLGGRRPFTPDLTLQGTQIEVRKRSGKAHQRATDTDQDIISQLKSEGLLSRPPAAGPGGLAFDVMIAPEFGVLKRPPARLAKLKTKKTKKQALTKEELEAKLKSAEERRKRKEALKVNKLNTAAKEKQVHRALGASDEAQRREVASRAETDAERWSGNQEARLGALRAKQEQRRAHAEKVRQARLARRAEGAPSQATDAAVSEGGEVP